MNSFMCRLTGGHRYDDSKLITQQSPDDINQLWVTNRCVKCGAVFVDVIDINKIIQADTKRSDNNAK